MTCPHCNDPMELSRYIPNDARVFTCNRCFPRLNRTPKDGYGGRLVISAKVGGIRLQEGVGEVTCGEC